jgi:hypothetical protein
VFKYSNDHFVSFTKGIWPFLDRTGLEKSYDFLINREIGDIVPPIEVELGVFHVYKILDRIKGAVRPIDEVKTQVQTKLMFELMSDYIEDIIHTHRIRIQIHEENLRPMEQTRNRTNRSMFSELFEYFQRLRGL